MLKIIMIVCFILTAPLLLFVTIQLIALLPHTFKWYFLDPHRTPEEEAEDKRKTQARVKEFEEKMRPRWEALKKREREREKREAEEKEKMEKEKSDDKGDEW
ncbi:MAG: hypothetical protein MJ033_01880 [Victivallaceae bacterium]|nr:hypothetical protein [Victivallaceae bacterium]